MKFAELKQAVQEGENITAEDIDIFVRDELEKNAADIVETESILRHIVTKQDGKPTAGQVSYFGSKGWETSQHVRIPQRGQKHLAKELRRMDRVIRSEMIAGTAADRAKLAKELETAKKLAETEGRKIREQIQALQEKLEPIERAPEALERRFNEANSAVERLRELVPAELNTISARLRGGAKSNSSVHELDAEVKHLESVVSMSPGSAPMIAYCQSLTQSHPCRAIKGQVDAEAWGAFAADAAKRLKALKPKLDAAQKALDKELGEARNILDFYVK